MVIRSNGKESDTHIGESIARAFEGDADVGEDWQLHPLDKVDQI